MSACRLVLVLISFVLLQTICEAGLLPAKRTINITNDVYIHSGLDLTVHCKSGDDDLGEHVLPFKASRSPKGNHEWWPSSASNGRLQTGDRRKPVIILLN
ncbi:hypothetical protein Dsin_021437 [Dipteronia sinensis]|uniref:S-protein homolog n=1 Tax=Dipteronia sinensis TaxID=43782 RepID=A0AAE0A0N7_9ROSI|nr:hypothetical protein Dsin_021437 [Dipteronia sinensis]